MTPADRLREKAKGLRAAAESIKDVGLSEAALAAAFIEWAQSLDLLADAWEALDWAHDFVPAGIRPIGPAAKVLARIEEIA